MWCGVVWCGVYRQRRARRWWRRRWRRRRRQCAEPNVREFCPARPIWPAGFSQKGGGMKKGDQPAPAPHEKLCIFLQSRSSLYSKKHKLLHDGNVSSHLLRSTQKTKSWRPVGSVSRLIHNRRVNPDRTQPSQTLNRHKTLRPPPNTMAEGENSPLPLEH